MKGKYRVLIKKIQNKEKPKTNGEGVGLAGGLSKPTHS